MFHDMTVLTYHSISEHKVTYHIHNQQDEAGNSDTVDVPKEGSILVVEFIGSGYIIVEGIWKSGFPCKGIDGYVLVLALSET